MGHDVKAQNSTYMALCSRLWMIYFLITIAVIGFPLSVAFYIPLYFISFFWPAAQKPADWIMRWGIGWLMRVQPWMTFESQLEFPADGVLLVSNHRSHLDVFLLLSRIRGIRILAKSSLFYIPFLNVMMKVSGQIPTRRGDVGSFWKAMEQVREKLTSGQTVHVFPEMTRCQPGFRSTGNFMTAPFMMARDSGRPVVPMIIEGTDDIWPRGVFALRPHSRVSVRTLEPLDPREFASAEALRDETRRRINEALA